MPGRMVYRPVVGRVCAVGFGAFALWWFVADLLGSRPVGVLVLGPALLAACAVVYGVLWRPAVVVDADGVELVNVLRDVRIPWAALEAVETRYALTLLTPGGRYQSWAAAAPGRPSVAGRMLQGADGGRGPAPGGRLPDPRWSGGHSPDRASRDLRGDSGAAAFMVEQGWTAWREQPHPGEQPADVRVRFNLALAAVVGGAVALAVLASMLT